MKQLYLLLILSCFSISLLSQSNALHVVDNVGKGKYVGTIENLNDEGSGLKIKINGNHGMWIPLGPSDGVFPPKLPEPVDSLIQPILNKISSRILAGESIQPPTFQDFVAAIDPNNSGVGNLIKELGLDALIKSSVCAGQEALLDLVQLPDVNLDFINLPASLPNIPNLPIMGTSSIDLPNFPNPILTLPIPSITFTNEEILGFLDVPTGFSVTLVDNDINVPQLPNITIPAFTPFNSAVSTANSGINTVNGSLESFLTEVKEIKAGVEAFDAASLIESNLLNCNDAIPFEEIIFDFPLPSSDIFEKALGLDNHFLTFVDQGDRELGSVRAIHPTQWITEQVSTENALEIASIIPGLISDDGNIVENVVNLFKLGNSWVKGYNAIGVAYKSGFGDYAEWLPREDVREDISYGDIIGIKGGKISKDLEGAEQVMVISKAPIVMGNAPHPDSIHLGNNVAFIGQVPVKVVGPVQSGDYILADLERSGYGKALSPENMTADDFEYVVGKSWESNDTPGFKFIQTIVGMHQNAWVKPLVEMQNKLRKFEQNQTTYQQELKDLSAQIQAVSSQLMNSGLVNNNK